MLEDKRAIKVSAIFDAKGLQPTAFEYGGRDYAIKKVNLMHSINDGAVRIYFFSVSDEVNFWKLGFNT
ncbi:MAG: hypothetical protein AAB871_03365, partial [Patescibacteria group bacterium]